jgi:hypothetical protein
MSTAWKRATQKCTTLVHQWSAYVITQIWLETYNIWKLRYHGVSSDKEQKQALLRLTPKVAALYNQQSEIDCYGQYNFIESTTDLLSKPSSVIKQWIHKATLRIKVSKTVWDQNSKPAKRQPNKFTRSSANIMFKQTPQSNLTKTKQKK